MTKHGLKIVLVSGPICSGKSEFVSGLEAEFDVELIKTKDMIIDCANVRVKTRKNLQRQGDCLDRETKGRWIADALAEKVEALRSKASEGRRIVVVDSVRKEIQIEAIRRAFGSDVHHIHLTAQPDELQRRFEARQRDTDAGLSYEDATRSKTEKNVKKLEPLADTVAKTDRCSAQSVLARATALLDLYPRSNKPLVDVLIGGQYGSEGKGNIVGHIASEYDFLVRVGGPNAGHQVYAEPEPEKYYHLPSGTGRAPHAKLILGAGAVIFPDKLLEEISNHQVSQDRLFIDPQAMIIREEDRREEQKSYTNISSTGQGVGIASARKMTGRSAYKDGDKFLARDCKVLKPYIQDTRSVIAKAMAADKRILLEGTQGTSLSLHHGQYPHVTTRDTTVSGCLADAGIAPSAVRKIIMVCRTYPIRVGGPSGEMDYEISLEEIAERSGVSIEELKKLETTTTTKRKRRIAEFDWAQLKDSVQLNGPTDIALTFVDYFDVANRKAYRFEQLTEDTISFVEEVERVSGRPVSLLSTDFDWRNVIDRRAW